MAGISIDSPARLTRGGFDKSNENLWVEQRLTWLGKSPDEATWNSLPAVLIDAHFDEVRRAFGGILRCRRDGFRTVCAFPGGPSALMFEKDTIDVGEDSILVSMRILGCVLARGAKSYGALRMGVSRRAVDDAYELSAWQQVEGYPSRFLRRSRLPGFRLAFSIAGKLYREYHAVVTFRSLERVHRVIESAEARH